MFNVNMLADAARVFRCPACGEEVNTSLPQCLFCHSPLDPKQAELAADCESKLGSALSDSDIVRMAGGSALSFTGIGSGLLLYFMVRVWRDRELVTDVRTHYFLILALASTGVVAVTFALTLRWFAKHGLLHFGEQLGAAPAAKMQTEYRKSRLKVMQGAGLGAASLGVWLLYLIVR